MYLATWCTPKIQHRNNHWRWIFMVSIDLPALGSSPSPFFWGISSVHFSLHSKQFIPIFFLSLIQTIPPFQKKCLLSDFLQQRGNAISRNHNSHRDRRKNWIISILFKSFTNIQIKSFLWSLESIGWQIPFHFLILVEREFNKFLQAQTLTMQP